MRAFLKSNGRWLRAGVFWPLVLLALPQCADIVGLEDWDPSSSGAKFDPGSGDLSTAVMCDIPKVPAQGVGNCASAMDVLSGMSKTHAAVALAQGEHTSLVLDFSPPINDCGFGVPLKTEMFGPFPDGLPVCLNCVTRIPAVYPDGNAVCIAKCIDLVNQAGIPPPGGVDAFCAVNAHVSTNFDKTECYSKVCSSGGTSMKFDDQRREQEKVEWTDFINTSAAGNTLTGTTGIPIPDVFTAGAASVQRIISGDAWVEFAAGQNNVSHVLGLALDTAQDDDPTLADIAFAISLNVNNNVYILNNGEVKKGPIDPQYSPGERFRVRVTDNNDGSLTITYTRLVGVCMPGTICAETEMATQTAVSSELRVDASFREANATLTDVTLVRIK